MSNNDTELLEVELNTEQCAKVALYMYEQWQEAMKPPLYAYYDFPTWLNRLALHKQERINS